MEASLARVGKERTLEAARKSRLVGTGSASVGKETSSVLMAERSRKLEARCKRRVIRCPQYASI